MYGSMMGSFLEMTRGLIYKTRKTLPKTLRTLLGILAYLELQ